MKFSDIKPFPQSYYRVNIPIGDLLSTLARYKEKRNLILEPEWQRGRVWSRGQKIAYLEYFFKKGSSGRDIYFNCSSWLQGCDTPVYCVDGLQRITAAVDFMEGRIPIFGSYLSEFEDSLGLDEPSFIFNVMTLKNKRDLLKVYLDFNSGGTPHNQAELDRVRKMIESTPEGETL